MFVVTIVDALSGKVVSRKERKEPIDYGQLCNEGTSKGFGVSFAFGGEYLDHGHVGEFFDWGGPNNGRRCRFRFFETEKTK